MVVVLWLSFVMAFIYKYAINMFSRPKPFIVDDDIVGHASYSDSGTDSETDEPDDNYMRDFYDETTLTPEWLALSNDEKKKRLDKDIDEYMSK